MATLATQAVKKTGLKATYSAAGAGGDKFTPGDRTFIHVKNASGASVDVIFDDIKTAVPDGATAFNPDVKVTVAPATEKFMGPFEAARFANTDGLVHVTYSAVTSVTVAVLK